MRRPFVAGNWKMCKDLASGQALIAGLRTKVGAAARVDLAVCPPFTLLHAARQWLEGGPIRLGAQNCHFESQGAFTGEVAPPMLKDVGCTYVIIGHSERRQFFGEGGELLRKKVVAAQQVGLHVIFCIGETLDEREGGRTETVLERQIADVLRPDLNTGLLTIAYEPVWAIGTGRTATPEQAQTTQAFVRGRLAGIYGKETAQALRIQYGGSIKAGNAGELFACPDIDGGLVGGASLAVEDFAAIIAAAEASA